MGDDVERMQAASGPSTQYSPSYHLAALASAAADSRVGHDNDGDDDDDDELLNHIVGGSSSESTVLRHLRSNLARPTDLYDEARPGRTVTQEAEGPTELAWQGKRLVWSRGCQVIRSYSYPEAVVHACWSWLDKYGPRLPSTSTSRSGISNPRRRQSSGDSHELFSPSQRAFVAELNGGAAEEARRFPPRQQGIERALIAVLQTAIIVYYPRLGEEYSIPKGFKLQRALPTSLGVLLQRTAGEEDWRRWRNPDASVSSDRREARLPTLFYLEHHFSEVIPIALVEKLLWPKDGSAAAYGVAQDYRNVDEHIIFASSSLSRSSPTKQQYSIVVTSDVRTSKLRLYAFSAACEGWKGPLPSNLTAEQSEQGKTEETDREVRRPTSNGRPSMLRHDSWTARGPSAALPRRSTRLSSASTPAREQLSTRQTPMTRRRSSKFPSAADKSNLNMARIDESFTGPAYAISAAAGPLASVPAQSERIDDAAEAEEMGQIVEGLAGRSSKGSAATAENSRAGESRRISGSVVKQKRNSQMARTPYVPRTHTRVTSASLSRRRSSKSAPLEGDVDHQSMYGLASAKSLVPDDCEMGHLREGKAYPFDDEAGLDDPFARRPALQLLTVIADVFMTHPSDANVFITSSRDDTSTLLYISTPKQLLCRKVDFIASGDVSYLVCSEPANPVSDPSLRAVSIAATGSQQKDTLILDGEGHLQLQVGSSNSLQTIPLHFDERTRRIMHWVSEQSAPRTQLLHLFRDPSRSDVVCLVCEGGQTFEAHLDFAPADPTVRAVLTALEIAVGNGLLYRRAWICRMHGATQLSEWDALTELFLQTDLDNLGLAGQKAAAWTSLLAEEGDACIALPPTASGARTVRSRCNVSPSHTSAVLSTLNAVAQDLRLDVALAPTSSTQLGTLIFHLAVCHGATLLADYWGSFIPPAHLERSGHELNLTITPSFQPKDVLEQTLMAVCGRFANKQAFLQSFCPDGSHLSSARFLPRIAKLFDTLTERALSSHDGVGTARWLTHISMGLSALPWCLTAVLRHKLRTICQDPPTGLSPAAYRLMGRQDLANLSSDPGHEQHAYYAAESLRSLPTTVKLDPLSAMIFPADRRLQDVAEMLVTSRPTVIRAPVRADKTDAENRESGIIRLSNVAERIKATQIGRGMFLLLTKRFDATQKWFTPRINLRIHLKPAQSYGFAEPRNDSVELEWPDFHNGAASALEMVVDQGKVDSTWYFSQSQGERSARHAGLLLGLGLAGRFATIGQVHTYRYLGDRHNLTSIGLLLGLSATFVAQGDPDVRALLACHVKAFLPPQSANLAHSTLVQSAALLGTGLLFLGADVSHIAEALCDQIGAQVIETTDAQTFCREAYSLSAALGLGLVMLGRGRRQGMKAARDRRILSKLERLIVGPVEELFGETLGDPTWRVDLRITASPAAIAYALLFLRSNDEVAASKIPLPSSPAELDKHRPDVLLIHSLARNLIMWNTMTPSQDWLHSVVPQFLRGTSKQTKPSWYTLALINIESGALFALSLKYAGSADSATKKLLLEKYHEWTRIAKSLAKSDYEDRILQAAAQASAAVAATGLSIVLAGTGDIDLLKLLRFNHGFSTAHEPYGHHMATHMALGVLFLGGGRFTFGNSDAAVAALLIAFYPRMPTKATDNRAHLQAYRHMWMLAVEPRLVTTREVDSAEVAQVPITITRKDGSTYQATTPHQLPHLDRIKAISVNSDRYWSSQILLDKASDQSAILKKASSFSVKRKAGHLSHAVDPQGQRSIMNASLAKESDQVGVEVAGVFTSPSNVLSQMAEGSAISRELARLLRLLPHQQDAKGLSKYLPEALVACLQRGHQNDLPLYLSLYQCYSATNLRDVRPTDLQDCLWLARFASQAVSTNAAQADDTGNILPKSLLLTARQSLQRLARASVVQGEVQASLISYLCSAEDVSLYDICSKDLALLHEVHNALCILSPLSLGNLRELVRLMRALFASLVQRGQGLSESAGGGSDDMDAAFEVVKSVGQSAVSEMLQKRYGSWVKDAEWAEVDEVLLRLVVLT
ncbi:hypothetical protein BCV69DRAFT_263791 [Microstroma glucosiphilum]|uniref:Uncharacterized protein n=1 Tax=Pseudomicrostroma glucosiphilum TaxID=1684307 RepID=A0A316U0G1_9BASI|nr:hypothetical protein BCV69DRAFT_263791 [Pseudomicrostroma glucosiphilum]PWN18348.1 hypothetical protein BCV69DRAFT_263791 [Pseudomicrostroma glucosiphilum]